MLSFTWVSMVFLVLCIYNNCFEVFDIWTLSKAVSVFCFLLPVWVTLFLFLCMSCIFFSKIGQFRPYISATVDTIPLPGLFSFYFLMYLVIGLDHFNEVYFSCNFSEQIALGMHTVMGDDSGFSRAPFLSVSFP